MTPDPRLTTEEITSAQLNNQSGRILETAQNARFELGELPVCFVTNRGKRRAAIIPAWLGDWIAANADLVLQAIDADRDAAR